MTAGAICEECGAWVPAEHCRIRVTEVRGIASRVYMPQSLVCEGPIHARHIPLEMRHVEDVDNPRHRTRLYRPESTIGPCGEREEFPVAS